MSSQEQGIDQKVKRFSKQNMRNVENSEECQRRFESWVLSSNNFSGKEKAAIKHKDIEDFNIYWKEANISKDTFDHKHDKGYGLWTRKYQKSATVVQVFMSDFSPIIQIVKDFAAPYGGLAVGTISVLFAVARNKDKIEERIASVITAINDRLPGLKLYQEIYNANHELDVALQTKIVTAYQGFIDFSIAATTYYTMGGPRRWLQAFGGAGDFTSKAGGVQDAIVDIRRLCEELLNKNIAIIKMLNIQQTSDIEDISMQNENIQAQNEELKLKNAQLVLQVKELQECHDNNMLNKVQRLLNLETFSDGHQRNEVQEYRRDLNQNLFPMIFEQMSGERLRTFESCKAYQNWIESETSRLLILSGNNEESIYDEDECWVSPVALNLIEKLREQHDAIVSYFLLRKQQLPRPLYDILPVILLRLLRQKAQAMRNKEQHSELLAALEKLKACEELCVKSENDKRLEVERESALQRVGLRVIDLFDDSETVYIIVDRVDRCRNKQMNHRMALLRALVKMVEAARCRLKVLVVINRSDWPMDGHEGEFGQRSKESVIMLTEYQRLLRF